MRTWLAVGVGAVVLAGVACDDAGTIAPGAATSSASGAATTVLRGEYLVRTVAGCGECHTPRDAGGNLVQGAWLAGVANRFDLVPDDDTLGGISAPNLTPTGLSAWSDAEIERAFLDGVGRDGSPLFPVMPYYAFHNMTAADADAIVAYLRAVPALPGTTPPRQPLPVTLTAPAAPIPASAIPDTTLAPGEPAHAVAEQGRYLAGQVGFCLDCHTPWRLAAGAPLDLSRAFAGGRGFSARDWGLPAGSPAVVYSSNATPDVTGVAGWTADDVARALVEGTAPGGGAPCRPMPSGPSGSLGGLSAADAHALGVYLTTLAPLVGAGLPACGGNASGVGPSGDASTE